MLLNLRVKLTEDGNMRAFYCRGLETKSQLRTNERTPGKRAHVNSWYSSGRFFQKKTLMPLPGLTWPHVLHLGPLICGFLISSTPGSSPPEGAMRPYLRCNPVSMKDSSPWAALYSSPGSRYHAALWRNRFIFCSRHTTRYTLSVVTSDPGFVRRVARSHYSKLWLRSRLFRRWTEPLCRSHSNLSLCSCIRKGTMHID